MESKADLRTRFRADLANLSREEIAKLSAQIVGHLLADEALKAFGVLTAYRPLVGEPDISEYLKQDNAKITIVSSAPGPIMLPEQKEPAAVLIPGLSFDRHGYRLGKGGGNYDRFLSDNPQLTPIGVCFDQQLVDELPHEPHDVPMRRVCTELGWIDVVS